MKLQIPDLLKTDKSINVEQKKTNFYCIIVKNNVD